MLSLKQRKSVKQLLVEFDNNAGKSTMFPSNGVNASDYGHQEFAHTYVPTHPHGHKPRSVDSKPFFPNLRSVGGAPLSSSTARLPELDPSPSCSSFEPAAETAPLAKIPASYVFVAEVPPESYCMATANERNKVKSIMLRRHQ